MEGPCGDDCFLFVSDDAVPSEVLDLSFRVCCVCGEASLSSLFEREETTFLLSDASASFSVSSAFPEESGQEGIGRCFHAFAEVALPEESVVSDVGDLPCCCWVGVCEGVSDGESFGRRNLEQFFLFDVALPCLLVGLCAGEREQDEEGCEEGTHKCESSAEGVIL